MESRILQNESSFPQLTSQIVRVFTRLGLTNQTGPEEYKLCHIREFVEQTNYILLNVSVYIILDKYFQSSIF